MASMRVGVSVLLSVCYCVCAGAAQGAKAADGEYAGEGEHMKQSLFAATHAAQ